MRVDMRREMLNTVESISEVRSWGPEVEVRRCQIPISSMGRRFRKSQPHSSPSRIVTFNSTIFKQITVNEGMALNEMAIVTALCVQFDRCSVQLFDKNLWMPGARPQQKTHI